jgi:predicted ArsR family transcriptional regulator
VEFLRAGLPQNSLALLAAAIVYLKKTVYLFCMAKLPSKPSGKTPAKAPGKSGSPRGSRGAGRSLAAIRTILKNAGPTDASTMAEELGVAPMAVRQHLYTMQEEGLVSFIEKAEGRGRPTKYWALTEAANAYFPDAHGDLAVSLLTEMREVFGEEGVERLLAARTEDQRKAYKGRLKGADSLEAKLAVLAEIRSEEGYMASSAPAEDEEGAFLLIENHCPVCSAAATCQGLCKYELELFQSVVGRGVEVAREEHILSGARRCAYRVRPKRASRVIGGKKSR